jgi:hypothetical protein
MYETIDGDSVPKAVAEQLNDPEDTAWSLTELDPRNIQVGETTNGSIYRGRVGGHVRWVDESGHTYHDDAYDHVEQLPEASFPRPERQYITPFTYRDDVTHVHHDHRVEHQTSVTAVDEYGTVTVSSSSGIMRFTPDSDGVRDETIECAIALFGGDTGALEVPDGVSQVKSGWHSSMEPSAVSDVLNALKDGEHPPELSEDDFPYAVRLSSTNNVCSVATSVYGTESFADTIEEVLENKHAEPRYAGLE